MPTLSVLNKKKQALEEDRLSVIDQLDVFVDDPEIDLSTDENTKAFDDFNDKIVAATTSIERIDQQIVTAGKLEKIRNGQTKRPANGGNEPLVALVTEPQFEKDPKCGFEDARDLMSVVMEKGNQTNPAQSEDPRLIFLATAGSDEQRGSSGKAGGYLIPKGIHGQTLSTDVVVNPIASMLRRLPMASPTIEIPTRVDKNRQTHVAGGLAVYRRAETQAVESSLLDFESIELKASPLMGLSYSTEELIRDSPQTIAALLGDGFDEAFADRELDEMINGSGIGEFLGITRADCTIEIAKESGQAANTLLGQNFVEMRARSWRYDNSVWMINPDCYTQCVDLHITLTNDDLPIFAPGNGVDVPDSILGRPVIWTDYAATVGDAADVMLANWGEYIVGEYEPLRRDESMHVRFERAEKAFRFYKRNAGMPWWRTVLTPKNSAVTRSPFLYLAERA